MPLRSPASLLPAAVTPLRLARASVVVAALVALVLKALMASRTLGPVDVIYFHGFSKAILHVGPYQMYGLSRDQLPNLPVYNHPPLAGWMLWLLGHIARHGIAFSTLIRLPSVTADFFSAIVVFEICRRRGPLLAAVGAGIAVSASPVLIAISAYHGNTDPICTMFALAAAWLLADRKLPLLGGATAALAISIKLVPIVVLPLLFVGAIRGGRRTTVRYLIGFAVVFLPLWVPALVTQPMGVLHNVLEYSGGDFGGWGLIEVASLLGAPVGFQQFLHGNGHFVLVLGCMAFGAVLAWYRPRQLPVVTGLTMALLLFLSTGSGVQYLAWAAPSLLAVGLWPGLWYNAMAGVFEVMVFTRWSGGFPWYQVKHATAWTDGELFLALVVWVILGIAIGYGVWVVLRGAVSGTGAGGGGAEPVSTAEGGGADPAPAPDRERRPSGTLSTGTARLNPA